MDVWPKMIILQNSSAGEEEEEESSEQNEATRAWLRTCVTTAQQQKNVKSTGPVQC